MRDGARSVRFAPKGDAKPRSALTIRQCPTDDYGAQVILSEEPILSMRFSLSSFFRPIDGA